jgi:type IV secretory pathway TrbL component
MLMDRIMSLLALALFIVFMGIIAIKIGEPDFAIAAAIGVALAGYDLFTQLGPRRRG